jgi:hypothetical protein
MIGLALIAIFTNNIRQTAALSRAAVTVRVRVSLGAIWIATARLALMIRCITKESVFAVFTVVTVRIIQTFCTLARVLVATIRVINIDIVVALAFSTGTTGFQRVAIVVDGTFLAFCTDITLFAVANQRIETRVKVTRVGELVVGRSAGTHAFPTLLTMYRLTVVAIFATVAIDADRVAFAVDALACSLVTSVGVAVTLTRNTRWKLPMVYSAFVTLGALHGLKTIANASFQIAKIVFRTARVAITSLATVRTEAPGARRTLVTLSTDDIWFALALTTSFIADVAEGACGVAFAWQRRNGCNSNAARVL